MKQMRYLNIPMKHVPLFLIVFLLSACSDNGMVKYDQHLNLDWKDEKELNLYDVKYIRLNYSPFAEEEIMGKGIEAFAFEDSLYTLDDLDRVRLISLLQDTANFSRGECGTFALNAGFLFLQNDTIKGIIEMGCGFAQWKFDPYNQQVKDGSISEKGFDEMVKLLDEIHHKMEQQIGKVDNVDR